MARCVRCGRDVDELETLPPDVITNELIDSLDHGEDDLAGEDDMRLCAECMEELKTD